MSGGTTIKSKILQRIDSEENWNNENPVLSSAEMVFSRAQGGVFMKIGDGRRYTDTPFIYNLHVDENMVSSIGFSHASMEEYATLLRDDNVDPNTLYVVSSECLDAYGQQIKNVADGTDLSDAVNVGQLQTLSAQLQTVTTQLASLSAWVVSQLSGLETIINSI